MVPDLGIYKFTVMDFHSFHQRQGIKTKNNIGIAALVVLMGILLLSNPFTGGTDVSALKIEQVRDMLLKATSSARPRVRILVFVQGSARERDLLLQLLEEAEKPRSQNIKKWRAIFRFSADGSVHHSSPMLTIGGAEC